MSEKKRHKVMNIQKITIEPDGWVWVETNGHEIGLGDLGVDVKINLKLPDKAASADVVWSKDFDGDNKDFERGLVEGWNACRKKIKEVLAIKETKDED